MPSVSRSQQQAMAIAEKAPDKLYSRNSGLLKMGKSSLRDFAKTKTSGLPKKAPMKP